jgi:lysophospholipase L1-like esterase
MKKKTGRSVWRTLLAMTLCGALLLPCVGSVSAAEAALPSPADNLVAKYGKEVIKIACIGDSVTYGVGGTPYPQQLGQKLGSFFQVTNFGVSGTTAQNDGHDQNPNDPKKFGYRTANPTQGDWNYGDVYRTVIPDASGKTVYEQSQMYKADIYIIAIGGNDAKDCNWNKGNNKFEEDYRALLEEYVNLPWHPLVIVGTSPAAVKSSYTISMDVVANEVVPIQRRVAAEMDLPFVETFNYTAGRSEYYTDDGVHLNATGYGVVADQYAKSITAMVDSFSSAELTAFTANGMKGEVDNETDSVYLSMPFGTDLTKLSAKAAANIHTQALEATDFSKPVTFTFTSADKTAAREYTVYTSIQRKIRVACMGDSVTAGGFPTQLQAILGEAYDVKNYGVNSTTAQKA